MFQQTAGPSAMARNIIASKLRSSRRRGTQSVTSSHLNGGQPSYIVSDQATNGPGSRFGDQNLGNTVLDNKGRAIKLNQNQEQTSGNLYDELSRVAEYQSSRSVLDGYSNNKPRNQQSNLNRTMQVKKNQQPAQDNSQNDVVNARESEADGSSAPYNREVISKSVLTNADRASPIISASGVTNGSQVAKMNIKKNQIKLVKGIATKRSSIQVAGSTSTGTGGQAQSKSVSRESRLKVKLVASKNAAAKGLSATPGLPDQVSRSQLDSEDVRLSQCNKTDNRTSSLDTQSHQLQNKDGKQSSPKASRNERKLVVATGPSRSGQPQVLPQSVVDNQRDFSPQQQQRKRLGGLSQATQRANLAKKIPFKQGAITKPEDGASASNQRIRSNFFTEATDSNAKPQQNSSIDSAQQHQAPGEIKLQQQPVQPLKIRRNRKQVKKVTTTIEEGDEEQIQDTNVDKTEDDVHFSEITRNLRFGNQASAVNHNIFIRKGSQYQTTAAAQQKIQQQLQHAQQQQPQQLVLTTNESESASAYKTGSVSQSRDHSTSYGQDGGQQASTNKSRQPFVRTFKSQKSRQVEDLDRPFGTERVSFHQSTLVANGQQKNSKNSLTQGEGSNSTCKEPNAYKRPVGSVANALANASTVRVQSHSQPPLGQKGDGSKNQVDNSQIIPPPTGEGDGTICEQRSMSAQMTGAGSINITTKRPIVKMTAINFIGPSGSSDQQSSKQQRIQVQSYATANKEVSSSGTGSFSFHHPQQQQQYSSKKEKSNAPGKKSNSVSAQLEASPYMAQQQMTSQTSSQQASAASKRVIHLKRPSTNFQLQHSNQPSLVGKNAFAQRAASRVEQIDHQHELSFQSNTNQGATSGSSMVTATALHRPGAQIRISKKPASTASDQAQHKANNYV